MNQFWCNFIRISKITIQPGSVHACVSLSVFPKARAVRAHQPPQNSVPLCARCFPLWLFLSHERKSQVHLPQQISGSLLGRVPRRISISGTHGMCAGDCPAWAEPHTALVQSPAGAGGTCPLPPRSRKLFHVLMCIFRMLMAEGSVV